MRPADSGAAPRVQQALQRVVVFHHGAGHPRRPVVVGARASAAATQSVRLVVDHDEPGVPSSVRTRRTASMDPVRCPAKERSVLPPARSPAQGKKGSSLGSRSIRSRPMSCTDGRWPPSPKSQFERPFHRSDRCGCVPNVRPPKPSPGVTRSPLPALGPTTRAPRIPADPAAGEGGEVEFRAGQWREIPRRKRTREIVRLEIDLLQTRVNEGAERWSRGRRAMGGNPRSSASFGESSEGNRPTPSPAPRVRRPHHGRQ